MLTKIQPARGSLTYQLVVMPVVRVTLPPVMIHESAQMGTEARKTMQMKLELCCRDPLYSFT